jgi:hypothetical protein
MAVKIMIALRSAEILNQVPCTAEPLEMAPMGGNLYDHINNWIICIKPHCLQ